MEQVTIFDFVKDFMRWVSPVILVIGLFLILAPKFYQKLELDLAKEIGGIKKRTIPQLETGMDFFHNWMLLNSTVVGAAFIACALIFFVTLR